MAAQVCNGFTLVLLSMTFFVFISVCASARECVAPCVFHAVGLFSAPVCLKTARFWWRVFALGMLVLVYLLCCFMFSSLCASMYVPVTPVLPVFRPPSSNRR